jgi:16S rRNA (cytidine1402-2'-O)-methyltransferase
VRASFRRPSRRRTASPARTQEASAPRGNPAPGEGILYLVATPIGNLEDITPRALRTLAEVQAVAAEDTRRTRRLLDHFGVSVPVVSLFEHNEQRKVPALIERLAAGDSVAVVTDAGSPGVADPGYRLVRAAVESGIEVRSVPGASAVIAALQVSGLPTDAFTFAGFLPVKSGARRRRLEALAKRRETVLAFEAPHRIESTLEDLEAIWRERPIALARELTKTFEEVIRGTAAEVRAKLTAEKRRGEMVLVLSGLGRHGEAEQDSE